MRPRADRHRPAGKLTGLLLRPAMTVLVRLSRNLRYLDDHSDLWLDPETDDLGHRLPGPDPGRRRDDWLRVGHPSPRRPVPRPLAQPASRCRRRPAGPVGGPRPPRRRCHGCRDSPPGRQAQVGAARFGLARSANSAGSDSGHGRESHGSRRQLDAREGACRRALDRHGGSAAEPPRAQHARPEPDRRRGASTIR